MSYELRYFRPHLKQQNYSNICGQNGIKNVSQSKIIVSPNLLNEEFPALSPSSVVPSKSCKQNLEIFIDSDKSSYSDKLQAKCKSYDKNDQQIEKKYNFQSVLNSSIFEKTYNVAASSSKEHTKLYCKENGKKGDTVIISTEKTVENSKQNRTCMKNHNKGVGENFFAKGKQNIKFSNKATESKNSEENQNFYKTFSNEIKQNYQKQDVSHESMDNIYRFKSSNGNMRNSFKYSRQRKAKDSDTFNSHKRNYEKVNKINCNIENKSQNIYKSVDTNHTKKQPGLMDESLVAGVSTTTAIVGHKFGRKKKAQRKTSKIKKQTAYQTGKLLILTPDLHSHITQSLAENVCRPLNNTIVDIGNLDEYPTLGSQSDEKKEKSLKKNISSLTDFHLKTKIKVEADINSSVRLSESDQLVNFEIKRTAVNSPGDYPSVNPTSDEVSVDRKQLRDTENGQVLDAKKLELVTELKSCARQPIQLFDLLTVSKPRRKAKKVIEVAPKHRLAKLSDFKLVSHGLNVLDSSAPNIKRGKEKEKPKQKKISTLKKIILSERLRKKELKEQRKKECLLAMIAVTKDFVGGNNSTVEASTKHSWHTEDLNGSSASELKECLVEVEEIEEQDNKLALIKVENNESTVKNEEYKLLESCGNNEKSFEDKRNIVIQMLIHVKGFREYCNHLLSKELNATIILLIDCLARFQDRQHQKDPVKARMKRRLTYGLKEVTKHLKLKKLKCVIIAPDLEDIKSSGGLNSALATIIQIATDYHIPCIFATNRKQLGKSCHKPVPVSCVGIFSFEGSEVLYKKTIELHAECIKDYQYLKKTIIENLTNEDIEEFIAAKENENIVAVRHRFLKDILSKEIADSEFLMKCNSNVFAWFRDHYFLKLSGVA